VDSDSRITEETVRRLADYADLPLTPDRLGPIAEGLRQFVALSESWSELALAFRFEDGNFSYAPWVMQYRPAWSEPTALNKWRALGEDGEPRA
jgi:hypothetical protein